MEDNDILATAESGLQLLALRRRENDNKLKSRFERIFEKYEYDFDGIGDEIDIVTGEMLIDNGHLENMRDEEDPDASESLREAADCLEEPLSDEEALDVDLNTLTPGVDSSDGKVDTATENVAHDQASKVLDGFARPAPRLARLLVNQDDAMPQSTLSPDPSSRNATSGALPVEHRLEGPETFRLPGVALMQSLLGSNPALVQSNVDNNAIQALGLSIAAGLMKLMSTTPTRAVQREANSAMEQAWSYPEPGHAPQAKRKMPDGGDFDVSDRRRKRMSLWAPKATRRPRKQAANASTGPSDSSVQGQSTQMAVVQPGQEADGRAPHNRPAANCETRETPIKRLGTLEYVSSLTPSQNTDELSSIESLRSECASLNLQGGAPYVRPEEALLILLKKRGMLWRDIAEYFPYRNRQSIQNLYQRKLGPKVAAVNDTDGPQQGSETALTDRIGDRTPSPEQVAASSNELNTTLGGSRFPTADIPSNTCSIECIPESPDHAVQGVEERFGQRYFDQGHRPSGYQTLESSGNDLRNSNANPPRSGPAREDVRSDITLAIVAKRDPSIQHPDLPSSAVVAGTERSSSAPSMDDANSTDLGLARPSTLGELLQAADAQSQSPAQAAVVIASGNSSTSHDRHQIVNPRVESSSPTGHLDVEANWPREGDLGPHVRLHDLERSHIERASAGDQLQSVSSAQLHAHQSTATIASKRSISKGKAKDLKTKYANPDTRTACGTPEKSAAPLPATHPTPKEMSGSHKGKRQSLGSANRSASRTPKHGISSTTLSILSSPSRAKTPVPRRSTNAQRGSAIKSAGRQRRFVETHVREINDSEDDLA
jgi:hypothetical protein